MAGKAKTHSWAAKRFKITKNKKVVFSKTGNNHLLTNKWKSNKKCPYWKSLESTHTKQVKNLIPYK